MSTSNYRTIDPTDPRDPTKVRSFKLPIQWTEDTDAFGQILANSTMISGAGMMLRFPQLVYFGLFMSFANLAHNKAFKKEVEGRALGGPYVSILWVTIDGLRP